MMTRACDRSRIGADNGVKQVKNSVRRSGGWEVAERGMEWGERVT